MKKKPTWFKLFPADFLADRKVERTSLEEFGFYCYLLMRAWMDGGIPASLDELARYAMLRGVSRRHLEKLWRAVSPCWEQSGDSQVLVNRRQEIEREMVGEYWEAKSRAGKASAEKRLELQKQKEEGPTHDEQALNRAGNNIDQDIKPAQQTETHTFSEEEISYQQFQAETPLSPNDEGGDLAGRQSELGLRARPRSSHHSRQTPWSPTQL